MDYQEPYRATKLWNEVITAFQSGMPLRKHRRKMHTYHDCFMASDAVTWIHCYLLNNPNFGSNVTRQQAINLLGKFFKCHVIESVTNKSKKCDFFDNSYLYRFTPITTQQMKTLPLRLVQSPSLSRIKVNCDKKESKKYFKNKSMPDLQQKENIPECVFIEKKMSLNELVLLWKTVTLTKLGNLLPDIDLHDKLDEKSVNGHIIKHNVCRISKTGVVSLIDKTDDIPHWVISAMKCLANWPNASGSGSCLPNYPGFEKDVFKVVRDFFRNPQVPLLPTFLSSILLDVFSHFLQDQIKGIHECEKCFKNKNNTFNSKSTQTICSVDIKTSTPLSNNDKDQLSMKNASCSDTKEGKLLLDDPEVMWDYPSAVYFETDFATSDPVTKMVPSQSNLCGDYGSIRGSIESISTISVCSVEPEMNISSNSETFQPSPLETWGSESCLPEQINRQTTTQSLLLKRNTPVEYYKKQSHSMFDYLYVPSSPCAENLNDSICSSKTLTEEDAKISLCNFEDNLNDVCPSSNQKFSNALSGHKTSPKSCHCSCMSEDSKIRNSFELFKDLNFPSQLISAFQLMLLFLHPPNRRQLHLLLRVINKILKNNKFTLDVEMPMRDFLLQTFLPAIVQSDINQNIVYGMVSFLLEKCENLFHPPPNLKEEVEELCNLRNGRIVYSLDDACSLTYCEMVSKQQYEEQKISVSTEALKNLLKNIIVDEKLSEKERRKRIKQFKENHPEVYYEMFPGKQDHLVKSKSTFLNRFASLRM